tara:strand:- start:230 stop:391 length:162 start_codon:yes stop_codon:yes gene_type:complete
MDSNTEKIVQEALLALEKTGLNFMLVVEDEQGVAIFSNSKGDRLYIVNKEEVI